LAKGADVNAKPGRVTALCSALEHNHNNIAALLVAKGADVNAMDGQLTPLVAAVSTGDKEIVELLLANKADVNASDIYGDTPLLAAVLNTSKDVVELLLAKGADVNVMDKRGHTPLWKVKNMVSVGNITVDPQRGFGLELGTNKSEDADKSKADIAVLLIQHGGHE
jgi:ankyrin repeat protein